MTATSVPDHWKELVEELQNFQEMARYLNPAPGEIPRLPGVDLCGLSMPLRDVIGGDHTIFIDFNRRYNLDERIARAAKTGRDEVAEKLRSLKNRAGILVADVSGHRMTDAFIAAMLHQAFLLGAYYELDRYGEITTRLFEHINTRFYRTTAINKYFTMIYGEIWVDGKFRFLSAGHQLPTVFSREFGRFAKIGEDRLVSFPPVGMFSRDSDDASHPDLPYRKKLYEVNEINLLNVGDILLVLTDGLVEHAGGEYFPARVEKLLVEAGDESTKQICDRLREDILAAGPPHDDISVVVVRRTR